MLLSIIPVAAAGVQRSGRPQRDLLVLCLDMSILLHHESKELAANSHIAIHTIFLHKERKPAPASSGQCSFFCLGFASCLPITDVLEPKSQGSVALYRFPTEDPHLKEHERQP